MQPAMLILAVAALAALNLLSFGLMAHDKRCAQKGKWRAPEKTLFGAADCFRGLGGVLGMALCRHKARRWYFRVFFLHASGRSDRAAGLGPYGAGESGMTGRSRRARGQASDPAQKE